MLGSSGGCHWGGCHGWPGCAGGRLWCIKRAAAKQQAGTGEDGAAGRRSGAQGGLQAGVFALIKLTQHAVGMPGEGGARAHSPFSEGKGRGRRGIKVKGTPCANRQRRSRGPEGGLTERRACLGRNSPPHGRPVQIPASGRAPARRCSLSAGVGGAGAAREGGGEEGGRRPQWSCVVSHLNGGIMRTSGSWRRSWGGGGGNRTSTCSEATLRLVAIASCSAASRSLRPSPWRLGGATAERRGSMLSPPWVEGEERRKEAGRAPVGVPHGELADLHAQGADGEGNIAQHLARVQAPAVATKDPPPATALLASVRVLNPANAPHFSMRRAPAPRRRPGRAAAPCACAARAQTAHLPTAPSVRAACRRAPSIGRRCSDPQ